jgi:hypothetical protein
MAHSGVVKCGAYGVLSLQFGAQGLHVYFYVWRIA